MAYGDNRQQVASDTFDSSISGSWTNPVNATADALIWVSGGHVEANPGDGANCVMVRNAESYANDQYSRCTVETHSVTATFTSYVGVGVRCAASTETYYLGAAAAYGAGAGTDTYELWEADAGSYALLASLTDPGSEIPHSSGHIVTMEAEGTTLRLGSTAGGSDAQKVTTTDATIASGKPAMYSFSNAVDSFGRMTAWSGGDIAVAAGVTYPRLERGTRGLCRGLVPGMWR